MIAALVLDALIGDPDWIWRKIPHPAALLGRFVQALDAALNSEKRRRFKGLIALVILLAVSVLIGWAIAGLPDFGLIETLLIAVLLAQRSLLRHVSAVARGLERGHAQGRLAVAMIVGRDPETLDEAAVARAAIESGAENFSDGVIAPLFWGLLFGLPGVLIYKAVNTADSMIGYKTDAYRDFGWAAARLDDVLNWLPARITGGLICLAHLSVTAFRIMLRDAPLHRSPNAGWPEAAVAAVTGVAISGPRIYDGVKTDDPFVNAGGRHDQIPADIDRAVRVIWRSWYLALAILLIVWAAT